jgi:hypothetical protein
MRKNKNTILLSLVSVFVISLFLILGFISNSSSNSITNKVTKKKELATDSLKTKFNTTVNNFDNSLIAASKNDTSFKVNQTNLLEYIRLKNEIGNLLNDTLSIEGLELAKKKIQILEYKIEALNNRNSSIEADNKRLNEIINNLQAKNNIAENKKAVVLNTKSSITPSMEKPAVQKNVLIANNPLFTGFFTDNNKTKETTSVDVMQKINGSVEIYSNTNITNAEIVIILLQPDGQAVRNNEWETGVFSTKEGNRKIYSTIVRFDYKVGESKLCNFSINAIDIPKGKYTLQVYYKGVQIATSAKNFS